MARHFATGGKRLESGKVYIENLGPNEEFPFHYQWVLEDQFFAYTWWRPEWYEEFSDGSSSWGAEHSVTAINYGSFFYNDDHTLDFLNSIVFESALFQTERQKMEP